MRGIIAIEFGFSSRKNQVVLYSGAILFDIQSCFHKLFLKNGGSLITKVVLYSGQYSSSVLTGIIAIVCV